MSKAAYICMSSRKCSRTNAIYFGSSTQSNIIEPRLLYNKVIVYRATECDCLLSDSKEPQSHEWR